MAINEREHHIKVLEQFLHDYQEWGEDLELEKTIKYVISSLKTDLKYDLIYEGEDICTRADMVTMLEELQLEIEEQKRDELSYQQTWNYPLNVCVSIIQQKINELKENEDGNR